MSIDWQASSSQEIIELRAHVLYQIRHFMAERRILEVETPALGSATVTDPHIESMETWLQFPDKKEKRIFYLQTSPEYAMKRLLASGTGAIYQISRAFRQNEFGKLHNPEFSLLEWYRPDYDHLAMMDEVAELFNELGFNECQKMSYAEVFEFYLDINPHSANQDDLRQLAIESGLHSRIDDQSTLLDFIFSKHIAFKLGNEKPVFIFDYPACQSALANLSEDVPAVAKRFELYISGVEIANGYNELCDVGEHKKRFEFDNKIRHQHRQSIYPVDNYFLAAIEHGLPVCAGVAMGLDRLIMALSGNKDIKNVLTFPISNA